MVTPHTDSTLPDFRPMKKTLGLKATVKSAVRRTLKSRRAAEENDTNTLATPSFIESQCSTLIDFDVGYEQSNWQRNPPTSPSSNTVARTWSAVVPDYTRSDYLRLSPDADTASIDTQMLDLEDNAWGPPRRSTAADRQSKAKQTKTKFFSRTAAKPKNTSRVSCSVPLPSRCQLTAQFAVTGPFRGM
ncbi:hypothetical protein PLEOSDRAFT_1092603 [Pleurotus ostreatus PC15]|uniref:Uncharacterized protein n=1 Tax=Pleurotus ostreatus (strain PC15) TaxID=1137138 RepID=A0A067NUB5_PLEO1|nr:hypothetical protein PLEOSDRAFT_1092603 [Pleurotus ostreatus PC15]